MSKPSVAEGSDSFPVSTIALRLRGLAGLVWAHDRPGAMTLSDEARWLLHTELLKLAHRLQGEETSLESPQ